MGEVQWIKIIPELFDDDKIQLIESMPEGDTILVIWFKLLCFAGKKNNGGVFMVSEKKPYDAKMFATVFHRPVETVELALDTFESFGMVEIIKHTYTIANWEKHQNIDGLDKIREQNRERKRQQRERQKKVLSEDSRDSHVTVTDGHATEEEREEEKEKELHSIIPSMRDEAKLKLLGGSLCQRIIMMSDEQFDDMILTINNKLKKGAA